MKRVFYFFILFVFAGMLQSCNSGNAFLSTKMILVTSESGDKLTEKGNVRFRKGEAEGTILKIEPEITKQTIDGIGSSFTESSAFVLAHLEPSRRMEVMQAIYGETGANFTLARTHIGSCDFSVEGKYSYLEKEGDTQLESFSIDPDYKGFSASEYPGVVDEEYDLLPMIKEALSIKSVQEDQTLRIVASAWTAPPWMKDIEAYFIKGTAENDYQGNGGSLKKEYEETYADYLVRYLDAYETEGVHTWGITPVNEPHGNNGQWESMHFTPETQNAFIKNYLEPKLKSGDHKEVRLLIYDQNRDGLEEWANVLLGDDETADYVYGSAVHWYASTVKVYEDVFERVHEKFPDKAIIHTEGCIDDLGKPAPGGITDPENFQEENWFNNDSFWWNPNATDWAYSATWAGVIPENHPAYTPVHRYARNIIVSIDHWMRGWIDWNIVLDHNGGPNHVGNFCGAPIMINTETSHVYYTPVYYILSQFSRTIRPGDKAVRTTLELNGHDSDALHACATINAANLLSVQLLNTTKKEISCNLQIGDQYCEITIDKNALQTLQIQL
jgi:glucosylceramidase